MTLAQAASVGVGHPRAQLSVPQPQVERGGNLQRELEGVVGGEAPTLGTGLGGEPGLSLRPEALPHCMDAPRGAAGIVFLEVEGKHDPSALLV